MEIDRSYLSPFRNLDFARRPWTEVHRTDVELAPHAGALRPGHVWLTGRDFLGDGLFTHSVADSDQEREFAKDQQFFDQIECRVR